MMPVSVRRQTVGSNGFALVTALLLLTVAAAVAATMMQKLQYQGGARDQALNADRARHAAAVGIDWASYRIARSGACVSGTLRLREAALKGFRVQVGCNQTTHGAGASARQVYALSARAQFGSYGQSDYAAYTKTSNLTQ